MDGPKKRKLDLLAFNENKTMANFFGEPDICATIIRHAIEREPGPASRCDDNWWLKHIKKYCQVSPQWQSIVLGSGKLFKPVKDWPSLLAGADKSASSITLHPKTVETAKELAQDGYLKMAKYMEIDLNVTKDEINFILSHAAGNQIESFKIGLDWTCFDEGELLNNASAVVEIFSMSPNARSFYFELIEYGNQQVYEQFCQLLHGAVHCNDREKTICIDCDFDIENEDDWDFTGEYGHKDEIGSIKFMEVQIGVGRSGSKFPNLTHLGRVETLVVMSDYFCTNVEMISQKGVKWLTIKREESDFCHAEDWREEFFESPIADSYNWPIPATETVTMIYTLNGFNGPNVIEWSDTFECGNVLWKNVRTWMRNVKSEWEELDGIDDYFAG